MRKILNSLVLVIIVLVSVACSNGSSDEVVVEGESDKLTAPDKYLQIATGPMGSGWYPITTLMAGVYMDNFDGLNVSEAEGGSASNLRSLNINDAQLSLNYTSDFVEAVNGTGNFDEPMDTLAGMASLYPVVQTIATLKSNDDINAIEDIIDKHIFLGAKDGSGPLVFWEIMSLYDIDEDMIKEAGGKFSYGNYSDGASMLKDGAIDVLLAGGAPMVPALQEIDLTNPIKVLPLDQDRLTVIEENDSGISAGVLPANTYSEQDEDVPTLTINTMMTVRKDLDEDFVYNLIKLFWESDEELERQVPTRAKDITFETALDGLSEKYLHPGAAKYYEEIGVIEK